ncbi:MAG: Peptidase, M23/M37 family [uncultured Chthoniobacterales bacterium]|uniref:Peptidase, M23/M37 family n=1 Tax=uncultured Chthoniobacterales bacterium TaxID=1836801 RepID=A0A6J4I1T0_9BACT|nr:MAG: Peptidase, M23/M37 family [uncultured Chthoniobacterales bacterium]
MKLQPSKGGSTVAPIVGLLIVFLLALAAGLYFRLAPELVSHRPERKPAFQLVSPIDLASLPTAARFDFPMGSEHGALAYNAQPFPENRHLGDDLNGIGGENSDFGDPVYSIADGRVILAEEGGPGWGNVIIVLHAYEENGTRKYVQSYYAHVDEMLVAPQQDVRRGEQIATVGSAGGRYLAHLHFEMREFITPFVGPGYRDDTRGWINPTEFISRHRGAPEDDVGRMPAE